MSEISIWGFKVSRSLLSSDEVEYLLQLPTDLPSVEWVWEEMDRVWGAMRLNNKLSLQDQSIGAYYQHPVWIMNGIFTSLDTESFLHRDAIADYLRQIGVNYVADYAGGFGELAIAITRKNPSVDICIVEPYPSKVGLQRLNDFKQISFVSDLKDNEYDAIVAQDILEHVEDPIKLAYEISKAVKVGGKIVFANCFYPVIKCHLPATFHLRCTFKWIMQALGLRYIGRIKGVPQSQVFERVVNQPFDLDKAHRIEAISKWIGPYLNFIRSILSWGKQGLLRLRS